MERKINQDKLTELATPVWTLAREAIESEKTDGALELLEYAHL